VISASIAPRKRTIVKISAGERTSFVRRAGQGYGRFPGLSERRGTRDHRILALAFQSLLGCEEPLRDRYAGKTTQGERLRGFEVDVGVRNKTASRFRRRKGSVVNGRRVVKPKARENWAEPDKRVRVISQIGSFESM